MSQPTDTTQPLPKVDGESTQEMQLPILPPTTAPAVPVLPAQPPYDQARAYAVHAHTVLGRLLRNAAVPMPMSYEVHLWTRPTIEFLLDPAAKGSMDAYRRVFPGDFTTEDRDPYREGGPAMRYERLSTVVEGIEVIVKQFVEIPAAAAAPEPQPEPELVAEAAAEPEPVHDPAPEAPAEAPAEHPEAA